MMLYLKYLIIWLLFMGLIAVVSLIVPKIAKRIDKWIELKKQHSHEENTLSFLESAGEEDNSKE